METTVIMVSTILHRIAKQTHLLRCKLKEKTWCKENTACTFYNYQSLSITSSLPQGIISYKMENSLNRDDNHTQVRVVTSESSSNN